LIRRSLGGLDSRSVRVAGLASSRVELDLIDCTSLFILFHRTPELHLVSRGHLNAIRLTAHGIPAVLAQHGTIVYNYLELDLRDQGVRVLVLHARCTIGNDDVEDRFLLDTLGVVVAVKPSRDGKGSNAAGNGTQIIGPGPVWLLPEGLVQPLATGEVEGGCGVLKIDR